MLPDNVLDALIVTASDIKSSTKDQTPKYSEYERMILLLSTETSTFSAH